MSSTPLDAAFSFASHGDWARVVPAARQALAVHPQDATAQALLALGLAHLEQGREAVETGRRAVALDPELPFAHYALGWALLEHDEVSGAERAAREALRLDPDGHSWALLGQTLVRQRRWQEALDAAMHGLELDPDHAGCANLRAMALGSLGRATEADTAVRGVLALDPEDAQAHANRGWLLLRQSDPDGALESFRTALHLDPTLDWARSGIIEALKARKGLYRLVLRYSLWMGTLGDRARWMIIIGLFLAARTGRTLLRDNPAWLPILGPLFVLYGLFVLGTWIADPLSNLLLRLNRFGRLVLARHETLASNLTGGCLAIALLAGLLFAVTRTHGWAIVGIVSVLLLIPIGGTFNSYGTRARRPLLVVLVVLAACGTTAAALSFVRIDLGVWPFVAFFVGTFLFSWVANYLTIKYQ